MTLTLDWTRLPGTSSFDEATSMVVGGEGSVYLAGKTSGNLDGQTNNGSSDGFISKFKSDGTKEWTRLIGTASSDGIYGLSVGDDGSIYLAGETSGNLDAQTNNGSSDGFISKFKSDGTKEWTRLIGSSSFDAASSISTGSDGSLYLAGYTQGNLDGQTNIGGTDAFVSKFNSDGTKEWTQLIGSPSDDQPYSISVGTDGSIYIAGKTQDSFGGEISGGGFDAFITKLDSGGGEEWTHLLGSSFPDFATAVTASDDGSIYLAGTINGNLDGQTSNGNFDAFIAKFNGTGEKEWTRLIGSPSNEAFYSISATIYGSIYLTGSSYGNLDGQVNSGKWDAFVSKFNSDGVKESTRLIGTSLEDTPWSLGIANDGSIYIAGRTEGDLGGQTNNGGFDAFVSKFTDSSFTFQPPKTYSITQSSTVNEGVTLTTSVATTGVAKDTSIYWSASGSNIDAYDFTAGEKALKGEATVGEDGTFSFSHTLANDNTTEGNETLDVKLFSDSERTQQVGETTSTIIADTSKSQGTRIEPNIFTRLNVQEINGDSENNNFAHNESATEYTAYWGKDGNDTFEINPHAGQYAVRTGFIGGNGNDTYTVNGTSSVVIGEYGSANSTNDALILKDTAAGIWRNEEIDGRHLYMYNYGTGRGEFSEIFIADFFADKNTIDSIKFENTGSAKPLTVTPGGLQPLSGVYTKDEYLSLINNSKGVPLGLISATWEEAFPDFLEDNNLDKQIINNTLDIIAADLSKTSPTYTVTQSPTPAVAEGAILTTTVQTTGVDEGTEVFWSADGEGVDENDFSDGELTGSATVDSEGKFSFSHNIASDHRTEGTETLDIKLFSDSERTQQLGETASTTIDDTSETPTYTVIHSPTRTVSEGATLTTALQTTGVEEGETIYWTADGEDIDEDDFSEGELSGEGIVDEQGKFSISHTLANDETTEGDETLQFSFYSDSDHTNLVGRRSTITVTDTSKSSPTYTVTQSPTDTVEEGETLTTTVQTTELEEGTEVYWSAEGEEIDEDDFTDGELTGSALVDEDGTFSFSHTLANDNTTEGNETLKFKLYSDSARTTQVGETIRTTINDTSRDPEPIVRREYGDAHASVNENLARGAHSLVGMRYQKLNVDGDGDFESDLDSTSDTSATTGNGNASTTSRHSLLGIELNGSSRIGGEGRFASIVTHESDNEATATNGTADADEHINSVSVDVSDVTISGRSSFGSYMSVGSTNRADASQSRAGVLLSDATSTLNEDLAPGERNITGMRFERLTTGDRATFSSEIENTIDTSASSDKGDATALSRNSVLGVGFSGTNRIGGDSRVTSILSHNSFNDAQSIHGTATADDHLAVIGVEVDTLTVNGNATFSSTVVVRAGATSEA